MANFPSLYKYVSWELNMSLDRVNWNRQTYSLLDWLGDLGGLADALFYALRALVQISSVFVF